MWLCRCFDIAHRLGGKPFKLSGMIVRKSLVRCVQRVFGWRFSWVLSVALWVDLKWGVWYWGLPAFTVGTTNSSHKLLRSQLTDPGYHGSKVSHPQGNPWRHSGPTGAAQAQQDISCDSLKFIQTAQIEKEKTRLRFINFPTKLRAASFFFFFYEGWVFFSLWELKTDPCPFVYNFQHSFNLRVARGYNVTSLHRKQRKDLNKVMGVTWSVVFRCCGINLTDLHSICWHDFSRVKQHIGSCC